MSAATDTVETVVLSGAAPALAGPLATLEISNAIDHLYKQTFARGPRKARAQLMDSDLLVVTLEGVLAAAERSLLAIGEQQRLHDLRQVHNGALEVQLRAIVEGTLGRRTVAFLSAIDADHDVAVHVFTLEPVDDRSAGAASARTQPIRPTVDGVA